MVAEETMQALVKTARGVGNVELRRVPVPEAGPGQVRVAVSATGICGTDMHIFDDEFATCPPVVMGHEVTGVVDQVGAGARHNVLGVRVALETYASTCGTCEYCRSGRVNLCGERRSIGSHVNGGFAEYVVVPENNLHKVDERVVDFAGALYEPLACVAQALCGPSVAAPGDRAVVVGPGAIGLLASQVLRALGAAVTVVGGQGDEARLAAARHLGLAASTSEDLEVPAGGFDVAAECSGSEGGVALALRSVRKAGHWAQIGLVGRKVSLALDEAVLKELCLRSANASTPRSWRCAERLVSSGAVDLNPLVSRAYPIGSWEDAFAYARGRGGVKVVLRPRGDR